MIIKISQRTPQQFVTHEEEWLEVFLFKEGKLITTPIPG